MSRTPKFTTSQALNSAALSLAVVIGTDTPNFEGSYRLAGAKLHAGSAISQTATVTITPVAGSNYARIEDTSALSSATNYSYTPTGDIVLKRGDTVTLACTNSGTPSITVYGTIELERID